MASTSPTILIFLSILSSLFIQNVNSAKILYLSSIGCKSAFSIHQAISKILIRNHHEIIAISPFPLDEVMANYTDVGAYEVFFQFSDQVSTEDNSIGTYVNRKLVYRVQNSNCENIHRNDKIAKTLKNIKIDLILFEIENSICFLPLLARFKVPIIGVNTMNFVFPDIDDTMGNPTNPSYIPSPLAGFSSRMNFFQRLQNAKDYLLNSAITWYYMNEADTIVAKYLKSHPIQELYDRISLVFTNNHFSLLPKPLAPNTVEIAGIHLENPSPLPKEIQTFMDGSTEGVIYLSLGSVAKFSGLPKKTHDLFVNELEKLPYRVIWRHDKPEMVPNTLKNVLVGKWHPQKSILAHPKVVLFISHCGMLSTFEAIHFGVPMLAFPVYYDQPTNAAIVQSLEIGVSLDLRTVDEQSLVFGIREVLQNKKYKENMRKLSNVFNDRPMSPQDTVIYWVEYALRHKDVSYLKPAGVKLPFYQYLLLDVILFLIVAVILASWIIYLTLKMTASVFKKSAMRKPKTS